MNHSLNGTVLLTGAAGFVGSHLCDALLHSGYPVVGLDDLSGGFRENLDPEVEFVEGSVTDSRPRRRARFERSEIGRDLAAFWQALV